MKNLAKYTANFLILMILYGTAKILGGERGIMFLLFMNTWYLLDIVNSNSEKE